MAIKFRPKVKGPKEDSGDMTFSMVNDPLADEATEVKIEEMPIIHPKRRGIFRLIIEPGSKPDEKESDSGAPPNLTI